MLTPRELTANGNEVFCAAVAPDGRSAVVGGRGGELVEYSLPDGKVRRRLRGHEDWVCCVQVDGDGTVRSADGRGVVHAWKPGGDRPSQTLHGHVSALAGMVRLDGNRLVTGGHDGTLQVWNLSTGERTAVVGDFIDEDSDTEWVHGVSTLVPVDGKRVFYRCAGSPVDGTVWDVGRKSSIQLRMPHHGMTAPVAPPVGGRWLVVPHGVPNAPDAVPQGATVFDLDRDGAPVRTIEGPWAGAMARKRDGRACYVAVEKGGRVRVIDPASGKDVDTLSVDSAPAALQAVLGAWYRGDGGLTIVGRGVSAPGAVRVVLPRSGRGKGGRPSFRHLGYDRKRRLRVLAVAPDGSGALGVPFGDNVALYWRFHEHSSPRSS